MMLLCTNYVKTSQPCLIFAVIAIKKSFKLPVLGLDNIWTNEHKPKKNIQVTVLSNISNISTQITFYKSHSIRGTFGDYMKNPKRMGIRECFHNIREKTFAIHLTARHLVISVFWTNFSPSTFLHAN